MYVYPHVQVSSEAKDNMESSVVELELQVVVSYSIWVPGTEPQFSTRSASALDNWPIFSAPWLSFSVNRWILTKKLLSVQGFFPHFVHIHPLKCWWDIEHKYRISFIQFPKKDFSLLEIMQYFPAALPVLLRQWAHAHLNSFL